MCGRARKMFDFLCAASTASDAGSSSWLRSSHSVMISVAVLRRSPGSFPRASFMAGVIVASSLPVASIPPGDQPRPTRQTVSGSPNVSAKAVRAITDKATPRRAARSLRRSVAQGADERGALARHHDHFSSPRRRAAVAITASLTIWPRVASGRAFCWPVSH